MPMASTEIPPRKPFLPPPLYPLAPGGGAEVRTRSGPVAVPVPKFLISLQDEIERSHRREAFWMSVLVHLVALVVFINGAKLWPKQRVLVATPTEVLQNQEYTFLVLPPDLQKNVVRPHTSVLSDKNRIASSRDPVLDRQALRHILASGPKGASAAEVKSARHQNAEPPTTHAPAEAVEAAAAPARIRPGQPQMATVPAATPPTASSVHTQAGPAPVAGTPLGNSGSHGPGAAGMNTASSPAARQSNVDVLSDTMGVDFGPYLSRVLRAVRVNWYSRIPESARAPLMKRGKVSIQFDILKTGQIAAMEVVDTSGDSSLDGAAIGGINQSGPFPPLPPQFQGQYLALRFHFFYNPDGNDLR
jgi:TonB family protein